MFPDYLNKYNIVTYSLNLNCDLAISKKLNLPNKLHLARHTWGGRGRGEGGTWGYMFYFHHTTFLGYLPTLYCTHFRASVLPLCASWEHHPATWRWLPSDTPLKTSEVYSSICEFMKCFKIGLKKKQQPQHLWIVGVVWERRQDRNHYIIGSWSDIW